MAVARPLRPLTARILAALPGPRRLWIVLWALVPALNAAVNLVFETARRSAIWEQSRPLVVLNYAALSVAVVITLSGAERIARRLEALRDETSDVLEGEPRERFREINSVGGPLVLAVATALVFTVGAVAADGVAPGALRGATWLLVGIPLWTFLWTYGSLQLGLDRLGRERLLPAAARGDPTLGLRPVGEVAFMGLWMLLAWLVPVLLTGLSDVVGIVIGALVLAGGLAAFFLSLLRLHRQMAEVRESELHLARELYAEASEPVRRERTLQALERQHSLLGAADALEKKAHAIHQWPIDEGTLTRVVTVVTSVIAMALARMILDPFGL